MIDMYFRVQELDQVMSSEKVGGHFYLRGAQCLCQFNTT